MHKRAERTKLYASILIEGKELKDKWCHTRSFHSDIESSDFMQYSYNYNVTELIKEYDAYKKEHPDKEVNIYIHMY